MQTAIQIPIPESPQAGHRNPAVGFRSAVRVQQSFVTKAEKKALRWLAERLPRWVNSDHLTVLGLLGMLGAGLSYWLCQATTIGFLSATVMLGVNWFGDSLDGTVARLRNRQRPRYGFYVDHICDAFGALFLLGGLALSGYMHPLVAAALYASFLLIMVEVTLATYTRGEFHMAFLNMGPTELRILLAMGNLFAAFHPVVRIWSSEFRLFDVAGTIGSAGMVAVAIRAAVVNTRGLYEEERLPESGAEPAADAHFV